MTVLVDIKEENLKEFYQTIQEKGWVEKDSTDLPDDYVIPQWQIDETMRRDKVNAPENYKLWSELRGKYVRDAS